MNKSNIYLALSIITSITLGVLLQARFDIIKKKKTH